MTRIHFLIDEDADAAIADLLRTRGHTVQFSREVLGRSAPDTLVAATAERLATIEADVLGAVVITRNCRHFRRLIRRETAGRATPYARAGLICLDCRAPSQLRRMEELIELIEAEHDIVQRSPDPRLIVEIGETIVRILR